MQEADREIFKLHSQLKAAIGKPTFITDTTDPYLKGDWHFYSLERHTLPLPDNPIFVSDHTTMVALSPRLLLEIDRKVPERDYATLTSHQQLPESKLSEYRNRCIANTFKEIIFSEESVLLQWKQHPRFRDRVRMMREMTSYNKITDRNGEQVNIVNYYRNRQASRARPKKS